MWGEGNYVMPLRKCNTNISTDKGPCGWVGLHLVSAVCNDRKPES